MVDLRIKNILNILQSEPAPVGSGELAARMSLSERTLRKIIQSIPEKNDIFSIELAKGQGYELRISDEAAFRAYMERLENLPILYTPSQRLEVILFYLLQEEGFITISNLEEKLALSRSTIIRVLKLAEKTLAKYNLTIERKAHFGIKVCGSEEDIRRAFSQYVLNSAWYLEPAMEYEKFMEHLDIGRLNHILRKCLEDNKIATDKNTFENILTYLKILVFRASKENFIYAGEFPNDIPRSYVNASKQLIKWIEDEYNVTLPKSEVEFFSATISSRASTIEHETKTKEELCEAIDAILLQLDSEFLTAFAKDENLHESLLLHVMPKINSRQMDFTLTNPLIEETYTEYANIFMVGLRFAKLFEGIYGFNASRDEIGYLTLHFATHYERLKLNILRSIKRIVVVCTTGGGSSYLLQLRLEELFSRSNIITTAHDDLSAFAQDLPDLFLTTIPIGDDYMGVPIVHIKELLSIEEIQKIKDAVYLRISGTGSLNIGEFFYEKFFQRTSGDYLEIIENQAKLMADEGFASEDFPQLVMERERQFTTIYANGIAGPHAMKLTALKNCIGVTILEKRGRYADKSVQMIFLINLMPGCLFLHKEISRLLLHLIDKESAKRKLLNCKDFRQFKREVLKML